MKKLTALSITRMALLAAVYAALTLALAPISFGQFQIRASEALAVLPFLFPEAVPALFVGCFLANMFGPSLGILDMIFGSLATLLAAFLTSRCKKIWLAPLPPVLVNAVVIGALLTYTFAPEAGIAGFMMFAGSVALGQVAACYGLGIPLLFAVKRFAPKPGAN